MREQLKLLEELQNVDAELHEIEQSLTALPAKLKSLKEDVARVESLLDSEQQQLDEANSYRAELEAGIKENQEQLNKAKAKLSQVRTSKEYMANQREMEATRKGAQEREDELLKLMEAIEQSQNTIKAHQEDLKALQTHVAEEESETAKRVAKLESEYKARKASRDKMTVDIRHDVLARYDKIQMRRGQAVVPARHGVCTGCNMQLPPQLFNILQRGSTIEHCPSCQRIVYFEEEDES